MQNIRALFWKNRNIRLVPLYIQNRIRILIQGSDTLRINAIVEPTKYNEHREFNEKDEHIRKQYNNNIKVPFSEVLKNVKRTKENIYL